MERGRSTSLVASVLIALACFTAAPVRAQDPKPAKKPAKAKGPPAANAVVSTSRGAYSAAQAVRGEKVYRTRCNSCHAATAYTGATFTQLWVGRTAYDLVTLLRRTMPNEDPGGLPKQQYVDVVAYLFRLNAYPAGRRALPTTDEELRRIRIDAPPGAATRSP